MKSSKKSAPATESPATEAPATEAPATEAPAPEAPATEAPAPEAPAPEAPAPEAPAPEAPAPTWQQIAPATIAPEVAAILSDIDKYTSGKLPRLGLLRWNAKREKVELVELVKLHGDTSRKSFENSKPFMDVLFAIGSMLPQSAYESLTYREARTLAVALSVSKANATIKEAIEKRLKISKFGQGWAESLAELATPAPATEAPATEAPATEAPATEAPATEAPATEAPATEAPANIVALPDSGPMAPLDLLALVKDKLRAMSDKQREIARGMIARLVNEPAKLAELLAA